METFFRDSERNSLGSPIILLNSRLQTHEPSSQRLLPGLFVSRPRRSSPQAVLPPLAPEGAVHVQASLDRVKWHECVIDLLSVSDAIADRDDEPGGTTCSAGPVTFSSSITGATVEVPASLSVRMDGFSLLTKADLEPERVVVATVRSPNSADRRVYALTRSSDPAAKHGRLDRCVVIDQPETLGDSAIRLTVAQHFD